MTSLSNLPRSVRLTAQQRALLEALAEQSPVPTTILYDVRVRTGDMFPDAPERTRNQTYSVGNCAGSALRRLEKRGFVVGERGSGCTDWWITEEGLAAIGLEPR